MATKALELYYGIKCYTKDKRHPENTNCSVFTRSQGKLAVSKKNWGVSSSWHLFVPIRVGLISSDILKSWSLSRDVPERFESGLVEAQEPLQIPVY